MKRVAIIGTHGIPAHYGGFETLAEQLVDSTAVHYTVFCSSCNLKDSPKSYKGADLKYIPLKANGISSILYDTLSLCRAIRGYDSVLILGVSGCIFLPIFRLLSRAKVVTNIDGLEHKRAKWGAFARWFLRLSERFAIRFSHTIIADNRAIAEYVTQKYGITPTLIAYGGDDYCDNTTLDSREQILDLYGVKEHQYTLAICRIEPENNCHKILQAAVDSGCRLLFIGNWDNSEYSSKLKAQYSDYKNITIAETTYDKEVLSVLRRSAARYIHGHSAGGTNPSLVEAMFLCKEIVVYDVVYNRETTLGNAIYFTDTEHLASILLKPSSENLALRQIAEKYYRWSDIRRKYEELY